MGYTNTTILIVLSIAYLLTVIGVIGTVLSENRNPLKASAWVLIVGFIPFVGLVAYILFGQDQRRLHRISKRFYSRLMRHPLQLSIPKRMELQLSHWKRWMRLIRMVERSADSPLLEIDTIDTFAWGNEMYERLFQDLRHAREHIHLQAYIFDNDVLLDEMEQILLERKRAGVDVRVIYDYLGSYSVPLARWRQMQQSGLQVYAFMPVRIPLMSSTVNYRNHRKVAIIDGTIGYVGGMNFADRYRTGTSLGAWRDTHFRITGTAVASLQSAFLMDWYIVSRRVVNIDSFFSKAPVSTPSVSERAVQFVLDGPIHTQPLIEQSFIGAIAGARHHIRIQTPYFLPTESLLRALLMAAQAGVCVEVMIPERSDSRWTGLAVQSYLRALLEVGIQVHMYQQGFLHSKIMTIDSQIAVIGSANMDFRSLEHNFEITGILYDTDTAIHLEALYDEDRQNCHMLTLKEWETRPLMTRLGRSVMRLFAPLL